MCFFLTVGVHEKHASRMPEVFGRGFQIFLSANASVLSALPPGYTAWLVTSGMCSCGLYMQLRPPLDRDDTDHLRRKYTKRGWGKEKVARAIEQTRAARPEPQAWTGLRPDVVERLQALCETGVAIAAVVHWYNGDVQSERLALRLGRPALCEEIPARAAALPEDEVLLAGSGQESTPPATGRSARDQGKVLDKIEETGS